MKNITEIAGKHLGQTGSYAVQTDKFDPSLLVSIPREIPRKEWDIDSTKFVGYDCWTGHEATFLTDKGLPIAGTLKIVYSSDSESIVESKSLKLFLNSFDMWKAGKTVEEATNNYVKQVKTSLEELLKTHVEVNFFKNPVYEWDMANPMFGYVNLYFVTKNLEDLEFTDYTSQKNHLEWVNAKQGREIKVYIDTLRSRCRITSQKDTGTALIHLKTEGGYFDYGSILQQVTSLRETNEFHEPSAEKLINDFLKFPGVVGCCVTLLYARRGSLDISPMRASNPDFLNMCLVSAKLNKKTLGQ